MNARIALCIAALLIFLLFPPAVPALPLPPAQREAGCFLRRTSACSKHQIAKIGRNPI